MNKKLFLKIILNIGLIFIFIATLSMGIFSIKILFPYLKIVIRHSDMWEAYRNMIVLWGIVFFAMLFFAVIDIIFLVIIDRNEMTYLCSSALKEYREHKEVTKEEQKQKKIEALEKELQDLKKDER